jgi:hypothetical protein
MKKQKVYIVIGMPHPLAGLNCEKVPTWTPQAILQRAYTCAGQ